MSLLNITGTTVNEDPTYRYKMPRLVSGAHRCMCMPGTAGALSAGGGAHPRKRRPSARPYQACISHLERRRAGEAPHPPMYTSTSPHPAHAPSHVQVAKVEGRGNGIKTGACRAGGGAR